MAQLRRTITIVTDRSCHPLPGLLERLRIAVEPGAVPAAHGGAGARGVSALSG
jgi:hypothetical protein